MTPNQENSNSLHKEIIFRFYAELNDFLPLEQKQLPFTAYFKTPVTVGEAIESLGIPGSEVDLVLVNSHPASRNIRLFESDYVSVYPSFESFDISELKDRKTTPLRVTRFILDAHLGKLAKYLRMLGFDTLYRNDFEDEEIMEISLRESRIILTRDKALLRSKKATHGYYIRAVNKHEQLIEVVQKFDLKSQFKSFTRCMTCNAELVTIDKEEIKEMIPEETSLYFKEFFFCPDCSKVFWKGSHFKRMEKMIRQIAG